MTNEQSVLDIEKEISNRKGCYMSYLQPIAIRIENERCSLTLDEFLTCQRMGSDYFNFVENFVGSSGLLGAHANGKWVTGFAETCSSVLEAYIVHYCFLKSHCHVAKGRFQEPDKNAFANMQRMTKEYLPKKQWMDLKQKLSEHELPVSGFENKGASNLNKTPTWQLVTACCIGVTFLIGIMVVAFFVPNPTPFQEFIYRGGFAMSLAATAGIIPGLLTVESRLQEFSVRATGAIAVFVIAWMLNPPSLVLNQENQKSPTVSQEVKPQKNKPPA